MDHCKKILLDSIYVVKRYAKTLGITSYIHTISETRRNCHGKQGREEEANSRPPENRDQEDRQRQPPPRRVLEAPHWPVQQGQRALHIVRHAGRRHRGILRRQARLHLRPPLRRRRHRAVPRERAAAGVGRARGGEYRAALPPGVAGTGGGEGEGEDPVRQRLRGELVGSADRGYVRGGTRGVRGGAGGVEEEGGGEG